MKKLLLLLLFSNLWICTFAQLPVQCPGGPAALPASLCSQACVFCDDLIDGYIGFNEPTFPFDVPPGFCAPQIHAVKWISFVAGSTNLMLEFTPLNCLTGEGLQVGLYGSMDCQSWTQVSNCEPSVNEGMSAFLNATGLVPGQTYFLVIDGNNGDICEFTINILLGSTIAPDVEGTAQIAGPSQACAGTVNNYSVSGITGAGYYNWTVDGVFVSGQSTADIFFPDPGIYQVCVTPGNSCFGDATQACIDVTVGTPPPIIIEETICEEEFPYNIDGFSFASPGVYEYEVLLPDGCWQQKTLILNQYPIQGPTDLNVTICQGETYSLAGQVFTSSGFYTLTLSDTNGCDSTIVLNLTVAPPAFNNLGVITTNEYLPVGNQIIDTYGDFEVILETEDGCDSLVIGFLDLSALDSVSIDSTICLGDTIFIQADTLTASGTYSYQIANGLVYDTFLLYNLTVLDYTGISLTDTICQGESYLLGDSTYTQTGSYENFFQSGEGCDSIVSLDLFVLQPSDTLMVSICDGDTLVVGNNAYTSAGVYTDTLIGPSGCQSIIQTTLDVLPVSQLNLNIEMCEGDSYNFAGQSLTTGGVYIDTLTAANGCDSLIVLDLLVHPVAMTELDVSICPGETYTLGAMAYDQPGVYTETFASTVTGCDSMVTLFLNWFDETETFLMDTICEGTDFMLGDSLYSEAGSYQQVFSDVNGCDSIVNLELQVINTDTTLLNISICEGGVFTWDGNDYTMDSLYTFLYTSTITGCDSLVLLDLEVLPNDTTVIDTVICQGGIFPLGNQLLDTPGIYSVVLENQYSCDSLVICTLEVSPTLMVSLQDTICEGETYEVGSSVYTSTGQYTDMLISVLGCDSIVMLDLTVVSTGTTVIDTTLCFGESFEIGPYVFTDTVNNLLQFTGTNGCDSLIDLQLSYYDEIQLENVNIQNDIIGGLPDGSIEITLNGGVPPYSYLWSNGRVGNAIDFLSPGEYFVIVTDVNGCQAGFYFDVYFGVPGFPGFFLTRPDKPSMEVRPNPFRDQLEVLLPESTETVELRLYDMQGSMIYRQQAEEQRVSMYPDLPSGVYWLVAFKDGIVIGTEKVVKVR
jgi:hypothetical protein